MKFKKGAKVVHIESGPDLAVILDALKAAKKTYHILDRDIETGHITSNSDFVPEIPVGTIIGMLFIETYSIYDYASFLLTGTVGEETLRDREVKEWLGDES